jgi:hypothetical protein
MMDQDDCWQHWMSQAHTKKTELSELLSLAYWRLRHRYSFCKVRVIMKWTGSQAVFIHWFSSAHPSSIENGPSSHFMNRLLYSSKKK